MYFIKINPMRNLLFILLLLCSCNTAKYYSRYRTGGNSEQITEPEREIRSSLASENSEAPSLDLMSNSDSSVIASRKSYLKIPAHHSSGASSSEIQVSNEERTDTTKTNTVKFGIAEMDDDLAQAFASPLFNSLAAIFGAASLVNAEFIWLAAPFYIGATVCILVGLICFLVALVRYTQGISDPRNKKYLWLWVLSFVVTLALAAFVLTLLI